MSCIQRKDNNPSFTSIVRAIKWWRNYKELDEILSSFCIELIVSYLEINKGIETNIEEGIIHFFNFVSSGKLNEITFKDAINSIPSYSTPVFIGDPTNNENNAAKKIDVAGWNEVIEEANEAFESLNIAQVKGTLGETVAEWKSVFGPNFNISPEN